MLTPVNVLLFSDVTEESRHLVHVPAGTPTVTFGLPVETLEQRRRIVQESDRMFQESLATDQERDRRRREAARRQAWIEDVERQRLQAIENRKAVWGRRDGVLNGILVRFRFPDGTQRREVFHQDEKVKDLHIAAGCHENATKRLNLSVPSSGLVLDESSDEDLRGLHLHQTTLNVSWLDEEFDQDQGNTNQDRDSTNQDRDNTNQDRDNTNQDRDSTNQDRDNTNQDRDNTNQDRDNTNQDQDSTNQDRDSTNQDRYNTHQDRDNTNQDRDDTNQDRDDTNQDRDDTNQDRDDTSQAGETAAGDPPSNLKEEIFRLASKIDSSLPSNKVNVVRFEILSGGMRGFEKKNFNELAPLNVRFENESGIDAGGPSREFASLAMNAIQSSAMFQGDDEQKHLILNYAELNKYETAGKIIAYCMIHLGVLPQFMSRTTFNSLSGVSENPTLSDICDRGVREILQRVQNCDEAEFNELTMEHFDIFNMCGCSALLLFKKRNELVEATTRFLVIDRNREAISRFAKGLEILGVRDSVMANPTIWEEAFLYKEQNLTAQFLEDAFKVVFSPRGSNKRQLEDRCIAYWRDFLEAMEEEKMLENLLVFATGLRRVPCLGFREQLSLTFRHPETLVGLDQRNVELPYANTCSLCLALPLLPSYEMFYDHMVAAITYGFTFSIH